MSAARSTLRVAGVLCAAALGACQLALEDAPCTCIDGFACCDGACIHQSEACRGP